MLNFLLEVPPLDFISGKDRFNSLKRDIKTRLLRHLSKWKHSVPVRVTPNTDRHKRVFVEIGTGNSPEWIYLIRDDWRDIARRKHGTDLLRSLPDSWCADDGQWHGYLVEAHPQNFRSLVETTVANKHYRPFLHRITFINAAIGAETSHFTTMGMEIGALKGLFVNRFSLTEARAFHTGAIDNTVDFGVFTVSLETLLAAIGHKRIDLLRLDVEGAEVPIFKSYPFPIKPRLLSIEYHSKAGETFVRRIFEKHGYQIDAENAEELRGVFKEKHTVE